MINKNNKIFKRCGLLFIPLGLLLMSGCLDIPDFSTFSDVYLTNNTPNTLSVSVEQSGDVTLIAGEQWHVYEYDIPPYTTKKLLDFDRQDLADAGQNLTFTATVDNEGESYQLVQQVSVLSTSSSMSYGSATNDASLALKTDLAIHRSNATSAALLVTEVAFQAKNKGLFKDVHYVITDDYQQPVIDENPDQLTALSYNIWALPVIANKIPERLAAMPEYLANYDVLLLQEVFAPERNAFLHTLDIDYGYSYQTAMLDKPGSNIFDGGVIILSRYPIVNQGQFVYPDCSGTDCFADKGVNYAEIIKNGRSYHVFATHAASFDTAIARANRQIQFGQIRDFASALNIPLDETVVYGGDFNVNKLLFPGDFQQMMTTLESSEPNYQGYTESTFDPRININAQAFDVVEYLDYVFVSDSHAVANSNVNTVRVPRSTDASMWKLWDLSDHFPVEAVID